MKISELEHDAIIWSERFKSYNRDKSYIIFEAASSCIFNDIERFRKLAGAKGLKMYIGAVYCIYGTKDVQMVIDRAGYKLRQEKEE